MLLHAISAQDGSDVRDHKHGAEGGDVTAPLPFEHGTAITYRKAGSAEKLRYQKIKSLECVVESSASPSMYEASTESPARVASTNQATKKRQ